MKFKFYDLKMHEKLLITYLILAFIPITILGTTAILNFRSFALENVSQEIYNHLELSQVRVLERINEAVNISNKLMIDQRLKDLLLHKYKSPLETYMEYSQYKEIENFKTLFSKSIAHIRIYTDNSTILENGIFYQDTYVKDTEWYKLAYKLNGFIRWELINEERDVSPQYYLSLVRLLRDVYNERFGVLVINLNKNELNNILYHPQFDTFILDSQKRVVVSQREDLLNKAINVNLTDSFKNNGTTFNFEGNEYRIFGRYLPLPGETKDFFLVSMIPVSFIFDAPKRMQYLALSITLISILVSSLVIFLFSKTMSKRVDILIQGVEEISKGNLNFNIPIKGKDEIGTLAENIMEMASDIEKLIQEVYVANLQKNETLLREKEAKLKLLTNQLNPHFLFNTLETIHMLAVCNNQKEIADISLKLGDLLRKTIEFPGHVIKLEEEISIVRDYLEIQKYRFDRIDYKIELHEDPSKIYIIPFLIQPLVENSIIHGLEKQIERGFIQILVNRENSNLIISVIDNGIGIDKSTKDLIFEKNTALMNIKERIKLHYGEEYGINVESEEGKGTKVQIILPYDKVTRGDENV